MGGAGTARRVLARNAAWNGASYLLSAVALLVLSPFVVNHLGDDLFGVWVVINVLTGYMNVADFGIRPAIVHFVAKHDALDDPDQIDRYVNSAFVTLSIGGLLVLVATCVLAPHLAAWTNVGAEHASDAGWALVISGVALAVLLPLNAITAVLIGKQRFDVTCRVDMLSLLASTAGIVAVLVTGGGIVMLALVIAVVELLEMLLKVRLAFREVPGLRLRPRRARRLEAKGLLGYGGFNVLVAAAFLLSDKTDALVIGGALSATWVTFFDRAAKLPVHARTMIWQVGRVLMPELGARDARDDRAGVADLLIAGARNVLLLAGPVLVYLLVLGGAFLETWMHGRAEFRVNGGPTLQVLAFAAAFAIASYPLVAAHQGTNRMRSLAGFSLLEGAANLGLSLWLVRDHGIVGVAWGTAIPAAVVHGLLLPWWNGRRYDIALPMWCLRVWGLPLSAGLGTYAALRMVYDPEATYGWPALLAGAAGSVAVFAALAFGIHRATRRFRPRLDPAPSSDASR